MKPISMRMRGGAIAALVLCLAALPMSASAAFVNGEIGFFDTWAPIGSLDLTQASGADFAASGGVPIVGATDDFSPFLNSDAWFFNFFWGGVEGILGQTILTFGSVDGAEGEPGGEFLAQSITIDTQTPTQIGLTMQGVWLLVGFDLTPGTLVWTGETTGGEFGTFSATGVAQPIPVPGALLLFASALTGLGFARRR